MIKMKVRGATAITEAFEELKGLTSSATARAGIKRGMLTAADEVVQSAKANTPTRTGRLKASIKAKAVPVKDPGKAVYAQVLGSGGSKELAAASLRAARRATKGQMRPIVVVVGAMGKGAKVAHLVEFGTAPHKILPKRKGALEWPVNYGSPAGYATEVDHPGARPAPFMRRAYEITKVSVADTMQIAVLDALNTSIARARLRAQKG